MEVYLVFELDYNTHEKFPKITVKSVWESYEDACREVDTATSSKNKAECPNPYAYFLKAYKVIPASK